MQSIASIGECMIELASVDCNSENGLPHYQLSFGGDTLNTSVYLARLGGKVSYATALGQDMYSQKMLDLWNDENVDTSLVKRIDNELPGLYIITNDDTGERTFEFWRSQSPARRLFEFDGAEDYFKKLAKFDNIYFSLITLSLYSEQALNKFHEFLTTYKANGGKIIIDNNYRKAGWKSPKHASECYKRFTSIATTVMPSFDDEQILMPEFKTNADCINYYKGVGVEEIVIKNGGGLVTYCLNGKVEEVTLSKIDKVVDTTAAGDSFAGGYLAGRLDGKTPHESIQQAHKLASTVILHKGALINKDVMPKF